MVMKKAKLIEEAIAIGMTNEMSNFIVDYCYASENHVQKKTCTAIINALRRGGVCTLEELRNMPEEELKTLRGIGNERLKVLLELKGQKTLRNYFTFRVVGGEVPKVTIEGKQLAVVTCVYNWSTSTDKSSGTENVVVGGYLDGGLELKIFKLDFKTNMANEI